MMKTLQIVITLSACCIFTLAGEKAMAQGASINATGAAPDNSAMFDISSNNKGILIPRMDSASRNNIALPAQGLMIYDTTTNCLEIYRGSLWQQLNCACTGAPAAAGNISGTDTICFTGQASSVYSYSVPAISGATSYTWSYSGTGALIAGSTNTINVGFFGNAASGILTVAGANACGAGVPSSLAIIIDTTSITTQPASTSACDTAGSAAFTVTATGAALTYQWQEYVNTWNNITNGGVYSGATTDTFTITNPPATMNGYKYRCIVVSGPCPMATTDGLATLTVNEPPTITSVTPGSRTGQGTVILGATASAGTINWYATATGGALLDSGTSFTTSSLCSTTNFYVDATANGCTTPTRTSVTATLNKTFEIDSTCSLTTDLVSYYKLDENGNDFFASNNLSNNNSVVFVPGKVDSAASFDDGNYLYQNAPLSTAITNVSMFMWVYIPASSDMGEFFHNGNGNGNDGYGLGVGSGSEDVSGNHLVALLDERAWMDFGANIGTGWHFVGMVNNAGTWTGYIDNVACPTTFTSTANTPTGNIYIGGDEPNANGGYNPRYWNGYVDELGFWNKALSTQEMTELYNGGAGQTMH